MESRNPLASVKDRIGVSMIAEAERTGRIQPGKTVLIEADQRQHRNRPCLRRRRERLQAHPHHARDNEFGAALLLALGAQIVLTPGPRGMKGAILKAEELLSSTPNSYMLQQFDNPANPKIHLETTGPEIWKDTDGPVDFLVSGVGTGGRLPASPNTSSQRNRPSRLSPSSPPIAPSCRAESRVRTRFRVSGPVLSQYLAPRSD